MKKVIPRLLMILALVGGGTWSWFHFQENEGAQANRDMVLYGNVEVRDVELSFRVGGRLAQLMVSEGDWVEAGTPLARLDSVPFEHELKLAEARLAVQNALLAKARAGFRLQEVEQAQAVLAEREATAENTRQTLERLRKLRRDGGVSQQNLDDAQGRYNEALARLEAARKQSNLVETGSRPEDIRAQEAQVEVAGVQVAMARTALEDTVLYAQESGIVLTRAREAGAVVQPGQTVCVLTLTSPIHIRAYVPQPDLALLSPGQQVSLHIDAMPGKIYPGIIGHISSRAEFTPKTVETREVRNDLVYRLRIIADDPDNVMRQGMPITVSIPRSRAE